MYSVRPAALCVALAAAFPGAAFSAGDADIKQLREQLRELRATYQQRIDDLERRLAETEKKAVAASSAAAAADSSACNATAQRCAWWSWASLLPGALPQARELLPRHLPLRPSQYRVRPRQPPQPLCPLCRAPIRARVR